MVNPSLAPALLCRVETETSEARQICENSCKAIGQAAGTRFGFIDATSGLPLCVESSYQYQDAVRRSAAQFSVTPRRGRPGNKIEERCPLDPGVRRIARLGGAPALPIGLAANAGLTAMRSAGPTSAHINACPIAAFFMVAPRSSRTAAIPARLSFQACGRGRRPWHRKAFALFLLTTLRHTGPVHIKLLDAPCLLRIFLLHCAAFLKGFHPRVIHGRSGVGQLDQRRRAKQDGEGESGNQGLHDISSC
jgi:hypothetical protein